MCYVPTGTQHNNKGNLNSLQGKIKETLIQDDLSPEEQLVERIRIAVGGGNDKEIAAKLRVTPSSITNWKRGEGPSRKKLKEIAEQYKVSLDYLQYGDITGESNSDKSSKDEEQKYESLFKDVNKLKPEHRAKFDAIMEAAEAQVAKMLQEQNDELPRPKGKKS